MSRILGWTNALVLVCACNAGRDHSHVPAPPTVLESTWVDATRWSPAGENRWRDRRGGELQVRHSRDASTGLAELSSFRNDMRNEILSRGGALVSADLSATGIGRIIAKFPQQPSGMTYEGLLVAVRDGIEYRVTVRFPETGITGVRDTAIAMLRMNDLPDDADPTEGWMADPYDGTRRDPLMRNVADDEQYDTEFPDHPLTLARAELRRLERSLDNHP